MEWIDRLWQSWHPAIQGIVVSLIAAIFLGMCVFIIRRLTLTNGEKRRAQESRLKTHFKELQGEVGEVLSDMNISEMYGLIVKYVGGIPQYHPDFVGIELPKLTDSFEAHFPKETKMYGDKISRILRNNENYKQLRQKIKYDFESEGIPVVGINPPPTTSPVIYDTIFWPLFSWWEDLNQGKDKPWPNFKRIDTTTDFGPNHLLVEGWGSGAIAYAVTDNDKQKCKTALGKVAENKEYESEASKTIEAAGLMLNEIRAFKGQLTDILGDINKFWPGIKKHKFKREKNCSRCKELFD